MSNLTAGYQGCNFDIPKQNCTLDTCCLAQSSFLYRPDYGGNLFYAVFFGVFILPQLGLGIRFKTWGYMVGMICGLILEVLGYVARVALHDNPFSNGAFLLYLIALTIAPVFITAAIYLCLSRIIVLYGEHLSYFKPRTIAIAFMCSDFLSLVLQAVGGAMAETATESNDQDSSQTGVDIMIAGLLLQAISLAIFVSLWAWFQLGVSRGVTDQSPDRIYTRRRPLFKAFQAGLLLATAAIVARSIYRVVELWGGFSGELWNDEVDFMILDGAMIGFAIVVLTLLHPGIAFGPQWHAADWSFKSSSAERIPRDNLNRKEREMKILWK